MKKAILTIIFALSALAAAFAAEPDFTVPFVIHGQDTLELDVYMPQDSTSEQRYCIIFSYGGGFKDYNQRANYVQAFCRQLADDGYVAIASDYRLGMKDVHAKSMLDLIKPTVNAITIATEDILTATAFTLEHADEWNIRKDGIILCGSSAGAMSSLQADYELCNGYPETKCLPEDFHYAGIVSFAGAVYSPKGKCAYKLHAPAPTLLMQGTADNIVPYDKIAIGSMRLSGSNDLVKSFVKNGYPYEIIRYTGEGHSVAGAFMTRYYEMQWFLELMVKRGLHYEIDKTVYDKQHKEPDWGKGKATGLY